MDPQPINPGGGPPDAEPQSKPADDSVPHDDCFGPPAEPCECYCLHCGRVFMSDKIWFQKIIGRSSGLDGFWMCPTPNCSGAGFTFDIFPTDPDHPANANNFDDEDEEFDDEDEEGMAWDEHDAEQFAMKEWDPEEADYAAMEDDDWEGEEWKLGLQPGERPPRPQWADEARREWEEEQRKFDEPDERPRELDWSDRPDPFGGNMDDIPF